MKKITFIAILVALALTQNLLIADEQKNNVKIRISQTVDHPALNSTTEGLIDGLEDSGYFNNEKLDLKTVSIQGSVTLAQQVADKFAAESPDIVVGVGTMASQSFIKYAKNGQKLVFTTVTNPTEAGLIGSNITGVSNFVPLEPQLELFKQLIPNLKTLGILYNSGEANSVNLVRLLEITCPKFGIKLVKVTASNSAEVSQSARELASKVDAIFISNDNTALGAMPSIVRAAGSVPVFSSDVDSVDGKGVLAALGPNQYKVGWQTGKMVARILEGQDVAKQKVEYPAGTELYLDLNAAKKLNIKVPEQLIKKATRLF